jgi:hypothetical protein
MKSGLVRLLYRVGLLLPAFRAVEFMRAFGAENGADGPDGLPLPPPDLRVRVAGTADIAWFLEGGVFRRNRSAQPLNARVRRSSHTGRS